MHPDTLLAEQVNQNRAGLVALVGKAGLVVLVLLHVFNVLVEQVRRVKRSALGLGVELRAENRARVVNQSLVRLVIQVGEVLPPLARQRRRVDSVSVVLRGNVALARAQIKSRDVVGTVTVLQLDRLGTSGKGNQLVAHTDAHNRDLRSLKQLLEIVHRLCAVSWVTRTVGDEDTVEVVSDLVDRVVVREAGNTGSARDEAAKNVLLDTAVDQCYVHVAERRADMEWCFGGYTTDEVDGLGVNESLVLIGVVLLADSNTSEGRTLLTKVRYDFTSINARDGRDTLASAPLSKRLNSGPMAVLQGIVLNNDTRGLDIRRFEVSEETVLIAGSGWDSVVANQGLGEDENLATVGGIGHGLRVSHERGGEDCFTRDVGFGTEGLAREDRAILNKR